MSRILYRDGSLFEAPKDEMLVHSVNCQGRWGAGIALEFKEKYPEAYAGYVRYCDWAKEEGFVPTGSVEVARIDNVDRVACLFVSESFGLNREPPSKILQHTHKAVAELFAAYPRGKFHSARINSGKFTTPWEDTAQIIEDALRVYPEATWTVWTPK